MPHCKRAEPFVEDLAAQYKDQIHVVKVNIDEQKSLAQAFRVQSIPTFVVIYEGTIVEKKEGFLEDEIIKMIEAQLA